MELFVADIKRIKAGNKAFFIIPTMLILVLTIVGSIVHYSRQHYRLQSVALPTIVGTKKKCHHFQSFLSACSKSIQILFKWYLNIPKHILPLRSVKDVKVICTII